VSPCYIEDSADIRTVTWPGDPNRELEASVSDQLHVHSKVMTTCNKSGHLQLGKTADGRSANATHDLEIALHIKHSETVASINDVKPYQARKFAAPMRRYIFHKHLGLLSPMDLQNPASNVHPAPAPSEYDFDLDAEKLVMRPLRDNFLSLWQGTTNSNQVWS
jgi:phospholipase D1/2